MKKLTAIMLTLALIFALCACGDTAAPAETAEETTPATEETVPAAEDGAETDTPADSAALTALLADFADKIQAGSAGSSLKAAKQAARLMDWAAQTQMTDEEISATAQEYLNALDDAARDEYLIQIFSLDNKYKELLQPGMEGMLEAAGVTDCGYPWGEEPMRAVEALMTALGQRNEVDLSAYNDILRGYYNAVAQAKADPENFIFETDGTLLNPNLTPYIYTDSLGYCYYDVDSDGVTELLIGTTNEFTPKSWVFDLYTLVDGECVSVFQGWERNVYMLFPHGTIMNLASASAANYWYSYYEMQEGTLTGLCTLVIDTDAAPEAQRCLHNPDGSVTPLTEEETAMYIANFESDAIEFDYIPISSMSSVNVEALS